MYGTDGLKVGPGVDGTLSGSGAGAEEPRLAPWARTATIPPWAWACSTAAHAPNKATPAVSDNVASTIRSILLLRIAISVAPIDPCLEISREPAGATKVSLGKLNSI